MTSASNVTAGEAIDKARETLAEAGVSATIHGSVRADNSRDVLFIRVGHVMQGRVNVWRTPEGLMAAIL